MSDAAVHRLVAGSIAEDDPRTALQLAWRLGAVAG
jgi:hypothetical protein